MYVSNGIAGVRFVGEMERLARVLKTVGPVTYHGRTYQGATSGPAWRVEVLMHGVPGVPPASEVIVPYWV